MHGLMEGEETCGVGSGGRLHLQYNGGKDEDYW